MGAASLAGAIIIAFATGTGAAWYETRTASNTHGRGPGPWTTSSAIGDASASMLTRAVVAHTGLWALPKSEVIYFLTEHDDDGKPLDARCTYELKGTADLPARWWSIAAYVGYHFVDNPDNRYSFAQTNVPRDADGGYTIRISRTHQPGNWLQLGQKDGQVTFLTRLYQPDPAKTADPTKVPLASVRRLSCA